MDILALLTTASFYVAHYNFIGYLVIFWGAFLETIPFTGLFVPANVIMALAGAFTYRGYMIASTVLLLAVTGGILGDLLSYWLGKKYNHHWENKPVAAKKIYFEKTEVFFKAHGVKSIFIARFIGPLRPFISFIAGATKMRFSTFIFFSAASAIAWSISLFAAGYAFGGSMETVVAWIEKIDTVILIIVIGLPIALAAYWLLSHRKIKARATPVDNQ